MLALGLSTGIEARDGEMLEVSGRGEVSHLEARAAERLRLQEVSDLPGIGEAVDAPTPTGSPTPTPAPAGSEAARGDLAGVSVGATACAYPWPRGCAWAVEVVRCESTFRADARNGVYRGWWQIDVNHLNPGAALDGFGWTVADLYDPMINTAAAWELYQLQGPGAWPWCGR